MKKRLVIFVGMILLTSLTFTLEIDENAANFANMERIL